MSQVLISEVELKKHLKAFKLSGMVKTLELRLKQAEEDSMACSEFLALMLEDEINQRTDNRRSRLYTSAHLPFEKGLEDFDFTFQPSIKKQEILELLQPAVFWKRKQMSSLSANPVPVRPIYLLP